MNNKNRNLFDASRFLLLFSLLHTLAPITPARTGTDFSELDQLVTAEHAFC